MTLRSYAVPYANAALARLLPAYIDAVAPKRPRRHGLPGRLVVSLTSYPLRFHTLPLTLRCLLSQSVAPDEVVLWIGNEHRGALTEEVLALRSRGLAIRFCTDLGSYTKIVPLLGECPDAYVVTADDDVYYGPGWLETLVAQERGRGEVLCHRAHRICVGPDHLPLPYRNWEIGTRCRKPSPLIFPTGNGGVLYPPGALHPDVADVELFRRLCPGADDVWLYWMMRRNGAVARKVGARRGRFLAWPGSQRVALWQTNVLRGGNDRCIRQLTAHFGFPHAASPGTPRHDTPPFQRSRHPQY